MGLGEITKPIRFRFDYKPTELQAGDIIEFYLTNDSRKFILFKRKNSYDQEGPLVDGIQVYLPIENSEEVMALIVAGRELGFKLFKKDLNSHVYILQNTSRK